MPNGSNAVIVQMNSPRGNKEFTPIPPSVSETVQQSSSNNPANSKFLINILMFTISSPTFTSPANMPAAAVLRITVTIL